MIQRSHVNWFGFLDIFMVDEAKSVECLDITYVYFVLEKACHFQCATSAFLCRAIISAYPCNNHILDMFKYST